MKPHCLALLITLIPLLLHSQSIERDVASSCGMSFENGAYQLEWTIGEIMTQTFEADSSWLLTQGFHQGVFTHTVTIPLVETSEPVLTGVTSALIGGKVIRSGGATVTDRGVFWGETPDPELTGTQVSLGSGPGIFSMLLENLVPGHTYYVVAYATNSAGIAYGAEWSFCMQVPPTVNTQPVDGITGTSAIVGGEVVCDGGIGITARGIYWGSIPSPQLNGHQVALGSGTGIFSHQLVGLNALTTYYLVAYATNAAGVAYGSEISFTTLGLPEVLTSEITGITQTSALLGGIVTSGGGALVTERGVFFGTDTVPELNGTKLSLGSGLGGFSETVDGLEPGTLYYVRAFATNSVGTSFGLLMPFETLPVVLPLVETSEPVLNGVTSAQIGGKVIRSGGATVTDRGVFWGAAPDPELTGTQVSLGSGLGLFSILLDSLVQGQTYYYVAYATNSAGIAHGAEWSFSMPVPPTVNTQPVDGITGTSAIVGGEVLSDGGSEITARGIYWGNVPSPQLNGYQVALGAGTGIFSHHLVGLNALTTYYFVAYAINAAGVAYGNEISFTTLGLPEVLTSEITGIAQTSALLGGNVVSGGGALVTERGVFYGTDPLPELNGIKLSLGSGLGEFSGTVDGLEPGTLYYVRAFATNSVGTSFGLLMPFETLPVVFALVETSNPVLTGATSALIGGNVIHHGGATVTDRGVFWGVAPDPELTGTQVSLGSGLGLFSILLDSLVQGQTYYYVAYASNSAGIAFGGEMSFSIPAVPPTVNTQPVDGITGTSAIVGGEVLSDGGSAIIARGIYWGTDPAPQLNGYQVALGAGTGIFSHQLVGLNSLTTYYLVAYATNAAGVAYGSEISFTTLGLPGVVTSEITGIAQTSALLGGNVVSGGGTIVTERGVFYGTDPLPELNGIKLSLGSGLGEFSGTVDGLEPGTLYYVRAFATNSVGTSFGLLMPFETLPVVTVPTHREIYGLVMLPGQDTCFSATQTITVAGNGQTVAVLSGANLQLVAGKSISLRNGFIVYPGGGFLARIDTQGNYCENFRSMLAYNGTVEDENASIQIESKQPLFRVFPNPTSGMLTIELLQELTLSAELHVYNLMGRVVLMEQISPQPPHQIDLSGLPRGIYMIRVTAGDRFAVERIIRK